MTDNNTHHELIKQDLMSSFSRAYHELNRITQPDKKIQFVDIMHRLRTKCLQLLAEARDS
jgi:hypothetical protein